MDLETKVAALEEELANHGGGAMKRGKEDALPRAPEKYSLTGHRNSVNSVRFHPTFSLVASASEDATVKVSLFPPISPIYMGFFTPHPTPLPLPFASLHHHAHSPFPHAPSTHAFSAHHFHSIALYCSTHNHQHKHRFITMITLQYIHATRFYTFVNLIRFICAYKNHLLIPL